MILVSLVTRGKGCVSNFGFGLFVFFCFFLFLIKYKQESNDFFFVEKKVRSKITFLVIISCIVQSFNERKKTGVMTL